MALGSTTEVINPATAPIIAAYPSKEALIVNVVNTSTSIHIHITISTTTDIMPADTTIRDRDDTPVLL